MKGLQKVIQVEQVTKCYPTCDQIFYPVQGQKNVDQFVSPAAQKIFSDLSLTRLPMGHSLKKHTFSSLAYLAGLGLPLVASGAAIYYGASQMPDTTDIALNVLNSIGVKGLATLAGVYTLHKATRLSAITNIFIGVVGTVATLAISRCILGCARSFSNAAEKPYIKREIEVEQERVKLQKLLVKELCENMYQRAALELTEQYKSAYNSPAEMFRLKELVKGFEAQREDLNQAFADMGLSVGDRTKILQHLNAVITEINAYSLKKIRPNDPKFNLELFKILPVDAFKTMGLTSEIVNHLDKGAVKPLGCFHKFTSALSTAKTAVWRSSLAGVGILVAGAPIWYNLNKPVFDSTYGTVLSGNGTNDLRLSVAVAAAPVFTALGIAKMTTERSWSKFTYERDAHNRGIILNNQDAQKKISKIYGDMADYLEKNKKDFKIKDLSDLEKKLALVEKQIAKYALENPAEATKAFKDKLQSIKKAKVEAQKKRKQASASAVTTPSVKDKPTAEENKSEGHQVAKPAQPVSVPTSVEMPLSIVPPILQRALKMQTS